MTRRIESAWSKFDFANHIWFPCLMLLGVCCLFLAGAAICIPLALFPQHMLGIEYGAAYAVTGIGMIVAAAFLCLRAYRKDWDFL